MPTSKPKPVRAWAVVEPDNEGSWVLFWPTAIHEKECDAKEHAAFHKECCRTSVIPVEIRPLPKRRKRAK